MSARFSRQCRKPRAAGLYRHWPCGERGKPHRGDVPFGRSNRFNVGRLRQCRRRRAPPRFGGTICIARCGAASGAIYFRFRLRPKAATICAATFYARATARRTVTVHRRSRVLYVRTACRQSRIRQQRPPQPVHIGVRSARPSDHGRNIESRRVSNQIGTATTRCRRAPASQAPLLSVFQALLFPLP